MKPDAAPDLKLRGSTEAMLQEVIASDAMKRLALNPPLGNSNVLRDIVAGYFADRAAFVAEVARLSPTYHSTRIAIVLEEIKRIDGFLTRIVDAVTTDRFPADGGKAQ